MKSHVNGQTPSEVLPLLCPSTKTLVRSNWKGPGSGNHIWRSGDQAARSTSTKFRGQDTPHGAREHEEGTSDWTGTVP